jgi:3-oxoacyl-[acyl-carrier protein] reductase
MSEFTSAAVGRISLRMTSLSTHSLASRVALVTGASSGIGQAIALSLAEAGADLIIHFGANARGAKETARQAQRRGTTAIIVQADLASVAEQDRLVQAAWASRPIDIWVNNAGADVLTSPAADWPFEAKLERLWRVDVLATIRLSREVGRRMRERGSGVVLNMGWDRAATGMEGDSGEMFAASKGAIMAFTRSLARSLAPEVRVNCLAPGWIRTAWGESASDYWDARARQEALLGRWGRPDDVARVARFLASDEAAFVTGQVININGGSRCG